MSLPDTKPASPFTAQRNKNAWASMPAENDSDFDDARRGFVATIPDAAIHSLDGSRLIWDLGTYAFLADERAPDTVHPSLWRQARLNAIHGLFEVAPRIYQIRGFDLANMTIVEGDAGIIVIDTLVTIETARAALSLYRQHRGNRLVVAVVYTHSHSDHFAGIRGVLDEADIGKVPIIAPDEFLYEAVSESVFAGTAMSRRALYFSGAALPRGARGQVDAGLGKTVSTGSVSLIAPTDLIAKTGERRVVDGVEMVFQMAPDTEAPAEMLIHFPAFEALCCAEVACPTMHNIYTPRGAQVRNARNWWKVLNEAIQLFGARTAVMFGQHHWPRWERQRIADYLRKQRDLYKFLHDQSLHWANKGLNPGEIAAKLKLPKSLQSEWYLREYYGTTSHNAKGVYQRYLGWYDGNPANLNPLPAAESGKRYVEFMGGPDRVVEKARAVFDQGDYRWVAQVLNHVIFADPSYAAARELQADALEQLGYCCESAVWRNMYLMGAFELRRGLAGWGGRRSDRSDYFRAMTSDLLLDYMGIRLNSDRASGKTITANIEVMDTAETFVLELVDSVLVYTAGSLARDADVTLRLTHDALSFLANSWTVGEGLPPGIVCVGKSERLTELLSCLDRFDGTFSLVEP